MARWTLGELAGLLGGRLDGPADLPITRPVSSHDEDPQGICFAESEPHLLRAIKGAVGALLVDNKADVGGKPAIRVESPRFAFAKLLAIASRPLPLSSGVHPLASVAETAKIAPTARIGAYAVVEAGAVVEDDARVYPFCYVGENCRIGQGTVLYPHVVLYQDVEIGSQCVLHSGCVLGADGFGFFWDGSRRRKIPQVGGVDVGDDVEVGANTTIDRATAGATRVGEGTKLDNLIQVAHNASIGKHTVVAGLSGISGSSRIGDRVVIGGGVGIKDHVTITDDVALGGRTGVEKDILEPGEYFGTPARPAAEAVRAFLLAPKLPELFSRLRALEKRLDELEGGSE